MNLLILIILLITAIGIVISISNDDDYKPYD